MAVKALMTDETGKQIVDAIREKAGLEERVSDLEKNKVDKSSIAQTTGTAEDKVMSQREVTEELEKKFDKSNVVQSTGDAEDKVMSQASATKEFDDLYRKTGAQIASFLESTTTNGIIRNSKSDPFGQTAIGGMKVVIDKGDLIINGNIKNHARLTRTYNVMQENRTEVFLYRFDSVTNEITGLWRDCIIQGDIILSREDKTELPLRSSGYYDILICKITIPAGATEITQDMIGDFRQNEYYCGYAKNLLVDIDETLTKSDAAADAAAVGAVISDLRNETRTRDIITEKRITNLEAGLPAERWSVDDSVAYVKDVPENALPFASVDLIGGMTRKCANLITPKNDIGTIRGLSFTNNADGSITVNGTATHNVYLNLADFYNLDGEYYISGCPAGGLIDTYTIIVDENNYGIAYDIGEGARFTAKKGNFYSILISVLEGVTLTNAVFKPMLNRGTTALPYEPYFDGLRSAPVTEVESVGVNLFALNALIPRTYIDVSNGNLVEESIDGWCCTPPISVKDSVTVSGIVLIDTGATRFRTLGATGEVVRVEDIGIYNEKTITLGRNEKFLQVCTRHENVETLVINHGNTALPYSRGFRNTLHIPAEVQALDGYGWGVNADCYNYIDWERKQFVKRVGCADLGTLNWGYSDGDKRFFVIPSDIAEVNSELIMRALCAEYLPISYNEFYTDMTRDKTICRYINYLFVRNLSYTDAATFKAAMSGVMLYYELATPVITDIPDLLPADNLIGVEGGGTVTLVNEYGYDVPSKITYQLKGAEA